MTRRWPGALLRATVSRRSGSAMCSIPAFRQSFGIAPAETDPTTFAALFVISITRYLRPNTEWYCFEKLTVPERVGTYVNFSSCAASVAPSVEPPARRIAVATPSIADAPVTNPPVPALTVFASVFTAGIGSSPKTDA